MLGFRNEGLRLGVWGQGWALGLGFRLKRLGLGLLALHAQGLGAKVCGAGFRAQCSG